MPPKRIQRRKSEQPSPRSEPIPLHTKNLEKALNSTVVVYVVNNGTPFRGILREYDKEAIMISPETTLLRSKIVAFYEAKNAPHKTSAGPTVR
jgi:small nuclear ribonucleoprotein (snRNP)-like protein